MADRNLNLSFQISADTTNATSAFANTQRKLNELKKAADDSGGAFQNFAGHAAQAQKSTESATGTLYEFKQRLQGTQTAIAAQAQANQKLTQANQSFGDSFNSLKEQLRGFETQANNTGEALNTFAKRESNVIDGNSRFKQSFNGLSNQLNDFKNDLNQTNASADATSKALNNTAKQAAATQPAFNNLHSSTQEVTRSFGYLKEAMAAVAFGLVADAANDVDKSIAKTAASMGIAREEAAKLTEAGRDIYKLGFGESLGEVNDAFNKIVRSASVLGITTTDQAALLTKYATALSQTFGTDIKENINAVTQLTKNFGITGQEAFDFIAEAERRGLNSSGDLLPTINEYSVQFKEAGASAGQFFSALQTGAGGGILGLDKVADQMKELRDRLVDGSDSTQKALSTIGINVNEIMQKVGSGQLSISDAYSLVTGKMKGLKSETDKMQVGMALFGSTFHDLGTAATLNVDLAAVKMSDLKGAMNATLTGSVTASQQFASAWRTVVMTFAESDVAQNALYGLAGAATSFAKNLPFLIETATTAAVVLGAGGLLYKGVAAAPALMTATSAAVTVLSRSYAALTASAATALVPTSALERTMMGMNGALLGQTTLWGALTTNLYGTSVAATAATGAMGVLTVAAGTLFAAFAGWQIGTYLYEQFDFAKVAGLALVQTLSKGWVIVSEAAVSPVQAIKSMFAGAFGLIQETFLGLAQTVVGIGEYIPGVGDQFKSLNTYLEDLKTNTNAALAATVNNDFAQRVSDSYGQIDEIVNESMHSIAQHSQTTQTASGINAEHVAVLKGVTQETKQQTAATQEVTQAINLAAEDTTKYKDLVKEARDAIAGLGKTAKEAALVDLQNKYGGDLGQTVFNAQQASNAIGVLRDKKLELQQVGLSDAQKTELKNTQEFNAKIAEQVTAIDELIKQQTALVSARNELNYAGLSEEARGYVDLMKELGEETAKTVIQMQQQADMKSAGVERTAELQEEIMLLKMSAKERSFYNQLKDVAPDQRNAIKSLLEEKAAIEANQRQWEALTDSAVDYIEKVATGELSFKDALKGFAIDFNKEQIKESMTKLKKSITDFFGGNKGVTLNAALGMNDAKMSADVQAASKAFEVYKTSLNDGTQTAVKTMSAGIDASIARLQKGIETALQSVSSKFAEVSNTVVVATKEIGGAVKNTVNNRLGALSEKFESGGRGAATVSTGQGDRGGVSYGTYQLASKTGTADAFVKAMSDNWVGQALTGLKAGTAEFSAKWKELAAKDSVGFAHLQHEFIKRTHYDPLVKSTEKLGVDLNKRSKALQDVVWSTGVQHGAGTSIVGKAIKSVGKNADDATLIKAIYDLRGDVKKTFAGSSEGVRASVSKRFVQEEKDALAMLKTETQGLAAAQTVATTVTQQQTVENQKQVQQSQQKVVIDQQQQFVDQQQIITTQQVATSSQLQASVSQQAAQGIAVLGNTSVESAQAMAGAAQGMAQAATVAAQGAAKQGGGGLFDGLIDGAKSLFSGDGLLGGIGDAFKGIASSVTEFAKPLTDALGGLGSSLGGAGGLASAAMSLFSGDTKGAIAGAISTGLSVAFPGVGSALGMVVGPVMNKLWGSWTVESKHLTTAINGLTLTNKVKTVEVNKGMLNGGKRTSYADLDPETQKQQQGFFKGLLKIIDDVGAYTGKKLTEQSRYKGVADLVHQDTDTAEKQTERLYSLKVKGDFTEQMFAGVDVTLPQTMTKRVQNLFRQASDGLYDKALQHFLWKPDTGKYSEAIRGPIQNGINDIIAKTDFSGMSFEDTQAKFAGYLESQFKAFSIDVPPDTWQSMADDLAGHVQDGLAFLSNAQIIDPDAGFFKQAREIVEAFNVWDLKPEEVKAFIDSLMGLKDAFKLAGFDASQISQEMATALNMDFSGLSSGLTAYYDSFLSEEEKRANKQRVLTDDLNRSFMQLGVQMPKTKDGFKTLIETMSKDIKDPQLFTGLVQLSNKAAEYYDLVGSSAGAFADAADGINNFVNVLGNLRNAISEQDVKGWLSDSVLNASNAQEAGLNFSNAFASAFQQQMVDTVFTTVSNMVFSGFVQPMLDASVMSANNTVSASAVAANQEMTSSTNSAVNLTSGSTTAAAALAAGGQVAASYIASVVANVKQVISVMSAVMKDESIKNMMQELQPALQTVGSETYSAVTMPQSITSPYVQQQSMSRMSSSGGGDREGSSTTEREAEKAAESLDDLRKELRLFGTGLKDTDLKLYELNDVFKNTGNNFLNFSGSAEEVANSLNALDDDALRKIASDTGISIDELEGYAMDYLNLRREEAEAVKDWQDGLSEYTTAGTKANQVIKKSIGEFTRVGLGVDSLVDILQKANPDEIKAYADALDMTDEEFRDAVPNVIDGLKEFNEVAKDFGKTLSQYIANYQDPLKDFARQTLQSGVSTSAAAEWLKSQNPQALAGWADTLGMSIQELTENSVKVLDYMKEMEGEAKATVDGLVSNFKTLMGSLSGLGEGLSDSIADIKGVKVNKVARLEAKLFADYTGNKASILQDNDALNERLSLANEYRQAIVEQFNEQKQLLEKRHDLEVGNAEKMLDVSKGMKDTIDDILGNSQFFSTTDRFKTAQAEYQSTLKKAKAGDVDAAGKLSESFNKYLGLAQDMYASSAEFKTIRDAGLADLQSLSGTYATKGAASSKDVMSATLTKELDALKAQTVEKLSSLNDTVETVQALSTNALVTELKGVGASLGAGFDAVVAAIKVSDLGQYKAPVTAAMSAPAVSNDMIRQYVQQVITEQGVNADSLGNIVKTATSLGIDSNRIAEAYNVKQEDVVALAQQYGLPQFAAGGIVEQATMALIGEKGKEAVIPLDKLSQYLPDTSISSDKAVKLLEMLLLAQQKTLALLAELTQTAKEDSRTISKQLKAVEALGNNNKRFT